MTRTTIASLLALLATATPASAAITSSPITNPTTNFFGQREIRSTITTTNPGTITILVSSSAYRHPLITRTITLTFAAPGSQTVRIACNPIILPFAWTVTATHADGSTAASYASVKCA